MPVTPQARALMQQTRSVGRGVQCIGGQWRLGALGVHGRLAGLLLCRPGQLPEAQAARDPDRNQGSQSNQNKLQTGVHQIILLMTILVTIAFIAILASLAAALFFMMRGGQKGNDASRKMARALGLRVGLSIVLFACILIAWSLGYIHPTGIPQGR
jgi:hypothetical protein